MPSNIMTGILVTVGFFTLLVSMLLILHDITLRLVGGALWKTENRKVFIEAVRIAKKKIKEQGQPNASK